MQDVPGQRASSNSRMTGRIILAISVVAVLALATLAGEAGRRAAMTDIRERGEATLVLDRALLSSELNRHRATPVVLASEEALKVALAEGSSTSLERVNQRLELLARQTGAAAIYVLNPDGLAVAANNYRTALSFVGTDYAFRPYYREAMAQGSAEYFAMGSVSGRPGLYLTRRIDGPNGTLGVIVVKVELDAVEAAWREQPGESLVADPDGVILLASRPDWKFRTLTPLSDDRREALSRSGQYGDALLQPMRPPIAGPPSDRVGIGGNDFLVLRQTLSVENWTLVLLTPAQEASERAGLLRWIVGLAGGLAILSGAWFWRARDRARRRLRQDADAREELEARVDDRTRDLTLANGRLQDEIDDRERAEARLRHLQADLVQANRLAQLGQTVAGVAHEINQPVAAIRANADNALILLDRAATEEARGNLARIQGLTERIGTIVQDLRTFARKPMPSVTAVAVQEAIEGSLLLVASRIRRDGVRVERRGDTDGLHVTAERIRLEQVLVNLLQNAFEALEGTTPAHVVVAVTTSETDVVIAVEDNGPGVSEVARAALFTPFATDKPAGLGLGLVISRDIVLGFGGDLTLDALHANGARFCIRLSRAMP